MIKIIVANSAKYFNEELKQVIANQLAAEIFFIEKKEDLSYDKLVELQPHFVFLMHWSYIVPAAIHREFNCIIFHMTDLPFGRGGSPLQNLIARGIYETKISAIQCIEKLDAGDIYLKKPLSLYGSAQEIYLRATKIITDMIIEIVNKLDIKPMPQVGEVVIFSRRQKADGNIQNLENLQQIFDYIRMLDADGYPPAFIQIGKILMEFERAAFYGEYIKSDVIIRLTK
ncbi:MAG: methionyl-tRNA formyltransferase [Neisseriaceae bacterium]|nr:MAG: methionyl-tRNA formyltransferase [Neisseriaceae bacterium]